MLLAEQQLIQPVNQGIAAVIGGCLVLLIREVVAPWIRARIQSRQVREDLNKQEVERTRKERKETLDREIKRLENLTDRLDDEIKERISENQKIQDKCDKEILEVRKDLRAEMEARYKAERTVEKAIAWIRHLSALLEQNNIPHPKWENGSNGTGPQVALPGGGG